MSDVRCSYNISVPVLILPLLVMLLITADFSLTRYGVARGLIEEGNPLLAGVMDCQLRAAAVLILIGAGLHFVARYGGDWVVWPMLVVLVSRVAVLWRRLQWVGAVE